MIAVLFAEIRSIMLCILLQFYRLYSKQFWNSDITFPKYFTSLSLLPLHWNITAMNYSHLLCDVIWRIWTDQKRIFLSSYCCEKDFGKRLYSLGTHTIWTGSHVTYKRTWAAEFLCDVSRCKNRSEIDIRRT